MSPDAVEILRVQSPVDAIRYRPSFVGAYQTVFSQPPYDEQFYPYEAAGVLQRVLSTPGHISLLGIKGASRVVGFGLAVPLGSRPDVSRHMQGLLQVEHTMYLAELGVLREFRGQGLGTELVKQRLALIDRQRFSHVLLRTSAVRNASYQMYLELGFRDIGVYMEVPSRRQGGHVTTDRRLFLSKVLAPED